MPSQQPLAEPAPAHDPPQQPTVLDPAPPAHRPAGEGERIIALDVARGIAVLGILLANVQIFGGSEFRRLHRDVEVPVRGAADAWVEILTGLLVVNTWLGMFSLLFGIGLALQLSRPGRDRLGSARILVLQRLFWLLLIGLAHRQLTSADILVPYALGGFALLILAGPRLPPPPRWAAGLGAAGVLAILAAPALRNLRAIERPDAVVALLEAGSSITWLEVRSLELLMRQGNLFLLLGWLLVGFWIGLSPLLRTGAREPRAWLRRGGLAVAVGLALRLSLLVPGDPEGAWNGPEGAVWLAAAAGSVLLTTGIAALVVGFVAPRADRVARWRLAAVGRTALTAYLFQTVVCLSVLTLPGARAAIGPAASLALVAAVWVMLLLACPAWLRRFRFGPVEWLWRSLAYRRLQPLRAAPEFPART